MEQIKVGDIVRVSEDAPSLYTTGWFYKWMKNDSSVLDINGEDALIGAPDECNSELAIPIKYLVKVNAEPKLSKGDISGETANELSDKIEAYVKAMRNIADDFDWRRYEADLAKEIAVKITNKKMDNDPEEIGEYAVLVAKSVVENLKKK